MTAKKQPMKKLTDKQIVRLFAPYIGCEMVSCNDYENEVYQLKFVGQDTCQGDLVSTSRKGSSCGAAGLYRLKLNHFKNLDDVNARCIAKILFPGNNTYHLEREGNRVHFLIDSHGSTEPAIRLSLELDSQYNDWFKADHYLTSRIILAYQFLQIQRYAIPVFIEDEHPDNGKTLFDLGLAVEK